MPYPGTLISKGDHIGGIIVPKRLRKTGREKCLESGHDERTISYSDESPSFAS